LRQRCAAFFFKADHLGRQLIVALQQRPVNQRDCYRAATVTEPRPLPSRDRQGVPHGPAGHQR
jgi:hypothetical protein